MQRTATVTQPADGKVADALHTALTDEALTRLDVAVAYVTSSDVHAMRNGHVADLNRFDRRWLGSLDWCRSDPVALEALDQTPASTVRIHDGDFVVARSACVPRRPFHPKGFFFSGPDARLLVSGSGNLSRNGITRGVELNTIIEVRRPATKAEVQLWDALGAFGQWFESAWAAADPYKRLRSRYRTEFARVAKAPTPTDDDASTVARARGYTERQLIGARRASVYWTEAGNLTPNLGPGNPGSQLMMRALTRVFFGLPADDVPHKTPLGSVEIRFGGAIYSDETLQFAHNGMDRLNLPHPGAGGPPAYDQQTLVFEKVAHRGRVIYDLQLAVTAQERAALRRRSAAADLDLVMSGGRRFGFIPD